ncbi:MAG: hypothetical protein IH937_11115 [Acidobacteria bacterium]|nr:hypothetical protein [Acidobacteriota bacterium]
MWFESRKDVIAKTLRKMRRGALKERDDSLAILKEIFDIVVLCKLSELQLQHFGDVNLKELQDPLFKASRGLDALWLLGKIDPYQGLPEDHSLSWPQVAEYLAKLGRSIPTQPKKGPGRPSEGILNLLPYMVWTTFKATTGKNHYKYVFEIVKAAGFRWMEQESLERTIRRIDRRLESKTGQNPS